MTTLFLDAINENLEDNILGMDTMLSHETIGLLHNGTSANNGAEKESPLDEHELAMI